MRILRRLSTVFLLACGPAWAADEITGPAAVPVHSLATVRTAVPADGYLWLVFPFETSFPADQADPRVLQFAGSPGAHVVILVPLVGGKPSGQHRKTVVFGDGVVPPGPGPAPDPGPTPPPGPGPGPGPGPAPVPPSETVWATLVYDVDAPDANVAAILTSPVVREAAEALNVAWRAHDDDAAVVAARNLLPSVAKAGGPPALVIQAADGRILEAVKCPPTPEGVAARFVGVRAMWGR